MTERLQSQEQFSIVFLLYSNHLQCCMSSSLQPLLPSLGASVTNNLPRTSLYREPSVHISTEQVQEIPLGWYWLWAEPNFRRQMAVSHSVQSEGPRQPTCLPAVLVRVFGEQLGRSIRHWTTKGAQVVGGVALRASQFDGCVCEEDIFRLLIFTMLKPTTKKRNSGILCLQRPWYYSGHQIKGQIRYHIGTFPWIYREGSRLEGVHCSLVQESLLISKTTRFCTKVRLYWNWDCWWHSLLPFLHWEGHVFVSTTGTSQSTQCYSQTQISATNLKVKGLVLEELIRGITRILRGRRPGKILADHAHFLLTTPTWWNYSSISWPHTQFCCWRSSLMVDVPCVHNVGYYPNHFFTFSNLLVYVVAGVFLPAISKTEWISG